MKEYKTWQEIQDDMAKAQKEIETLERKLKEAIEFRNWLTVQRPKKNAQS